MEKDVINDEKRNQKPVSYVGNSWIVSHSKSHPGHVYYFNTLTGDAVWNLSDAEIEKSASTKIQPGSKPIVCCEPKDNPPALKVLQNTLSNNSRLQQQQHSSTFQQQKLQQQPKEMFGQHPNLKLLQSQQQSASIYPDIPMNDLSAFDLNALSNQVNAYNIINNPGVYAPDGWPIPRTQQIIITPTIPLVNQAQSNASLNVAYNQLISTEQTNGPRFNKFQNRQRLFQPRHQFGRGAQRNFRKSLSSLDANDLRQQLYLKRRLNNVANAMDSDANFTSEDVHVSVNNRNDDVVVRRNVKTADVSSHIANVIQEEFNSKEKCNTMQDSNNTDPQIEAISSKLDLTPLKSLAPSNAKPGSCYIVVDLRVLLDEFDFLNAIVDSDESCHLTIPQHVMSQLKDYIARSNNIPARRILYSLSQLIENGCVSVAEECTQDYGVTITNPILKTCLHLFEENFHVILIAKENELLNCKKFMKIEIFSADDVKTLLEYNPLNYPTKVKTVSHSTNTPSTHRSLFTRSKTPIVYTSVEKTTTVKPVATESNKEIDIKAKTNILPSKHTVDAAIQTDIVTVINPDTITEKVDTQKQTISESKNNTETSKESSITPSATTESANKRREIKLKRSISHQPVQSTNAASNEKRIFRWRRNRNLNATTSNNEQPTQDQITQDVAQVALIQTDNVNHNEKELAHKPDNKETEANPCPNIESRGSSIISVDRSSRRENITIEETSTSGIISNTESNIDVDVEYNTLQENQHDESNDIIPEIVSYDIESESMEESLKTKCEEWVSRFIQTMEEALSVVLRKETMFSNIEFPPPWTLHEAALCIGKYSNLFSVKYVTDKLSCQLFDLSDSTGKIYLNITPRQFMKMFSYGVALLKEIKAITTCEDIEIAEESLQKLLSDIKNPLHVCNDSIIDTHEDPPNMQVTNMDSNQKTNCNRTSPRLKQVTQVQDDTPVQIEPDKGTKTMFFSNLSLMEVSSPIANAGEENENSDGQPNALPSLTVSNEDADNILCDEGKDECDNTVKANIVRNFSKCTEFEEKLKNKYNSNPSMVTDDEYLDYEEDYEYTTAEQLQTDEFDMFDESAVLSDPNVTQTLDTSDVTDSVVASSPNSVDPSLASINITFKLMMCGFLEEVSKAMKEVKGLCDKCYSELRRPQLSVADRNELKSKVENAHSNVLGLCLSLESMLQRDPNAPTDNMRTALTNAGINISQVDRNLILEYWNTVASCKKHVEVFLYSILEIIAAFKS